MGWSRLTITGVRSGRLSQLSTAFVNVGIAGHPIHAWYHVANWEFVLMISEGYKAAASDLCWSLSGKEVLALFGGIS